MNINRIDIKILVDLYKSVDGLFPYTFFQRYEYSPVTVFNSVVKYSEYIESVDGKLYISEKGKEFIEKNRFTYNKDRFDRIPAEFKVPKLEINTPYLPNLKKVSKNILLLQDKDDG